MVSGRGLLVLGFLVFLCSLEGGALSGSMGWWWLLSGWEQWGGWYVYWFILFAGRGGVVMFVGGWDGLCTHFHVPSCWLVSLSSLSFPSVFSVFVLGWLCYVKWEVPGVSFFFFFFCVIW